MIIKLTYDTQAQAEIATDPAFKASMEAAADMLEDHITSNITVNIQVGFGEVDGAALPPGAAAVGGLWTAPTVSYSDLRTALVNSGSAGANTLPAGSSIDGHSS